MRRDICIQVFQDIPLGQRDVWKKQVFQSPVPHPCLLRTSRIPCTHRALHRHRAFPGVWSLLPFLTAIIPCVSSISILTFSSITEFSLKSFLAWPYKNVFDDIWYTTVLFSFWQYSLPGKSLLLQKVTIRKISPQKLFSRRSEWMEIQEYKNKLPLSPFIYVEACLLSNGNIYSPHPLIALDLNTFLRIKRKLHQDCIGPRMWLQFVIRDVSGRKRNDFLFHQPEKKQL